MTAQQKTKKQIIIKVSLGILLTLSTIGFIFSDFQSFSVGSNNTLRTVGDIDITTQDLNRERDGLARMLGTIPQDAMIQQQIIEQGLENITLRSVLSEYTTAHGILASNDEIIKNIHTIPVFHGNNGHFDGMIFKNILQSQGISVKEFKNNIAQNIVRESFSAPLATEFPLHDKMAQTFNEFAFTKIHFTAYHLDYNKLPDNIKKINPPTDAELKQIYTQKKSQLNRPALKNIDYAIFDADNLHDKIKVSDAQISDFYNTNKDKLYTQAEKRKVLQIVLDNQKKALDVYNTIKKSGNFQATAKNMGYKSSDIDLGFVTADDITDKVAQQQVFNKQAGTILEPKKTDFGYVIYFIESIQPKKVQPLNNVKQEIKNTLFEKSLSHYLEEIMPKIDDDLAGGATLSEITQKYGSKIMTQNNITADGFIYDNEILNNPSIEMKKFDSHIPLEDINHYDVNDDIPLITGDNNIFTILKITASKPQSPLSFDEAKQALNIAEIQKQKNIILKTVLQKLQNHADKQKFCADHFIHTKNYTINRNGNLPQEIDLPKFSKIIFAKDNTTHLAHINHDNHTAIMLGVNKITPPQDITAEQSEDFGLKLQKNYDSYIQTEALNMLRNSVTIQTSDEIFNDYLTKALDN